jgi:hypothetical protein
VDVFDPAIRALLTVFPGMPAGVIGEHERIGWTRSASVRERSARFRPLFAPPDINGRA